VSTYLFLTQFYRTVTYCHMARITPENRPTFYLKEWRQHLGMSQAELGEWVGEKGVTSVAVGHWEKWDQPNGRVPDINVLAALAEAMGIELVDLFRPPNMHDWLNKNNKQTG
jgi:transcriptional regulator with XRE-family HTH domain